MIPPRPRLAAYVLALFLASVVVTVPRSSTAQPAQGAPAVTADDYKRAERFLAAGVNPLVFGGTVNATWLADGRFTYRSTTADGSEFLIVDPAKKTRERHVAPHGGVLGLTDSDYCCTIRHVRLLPGLPRGSVAAGVHSSHGRRRGSLHRT